MKPWHLALRDLGACEEARAWVALQLSSEPTLTFEEAWARCPRGDWMDWLLRSCRRWVAAGTAYVEMRAEFGNRFSCSPELLVVWADRLRNTVTDKLIAEIEQKLREDDE